MIDAKTAIQSEPPQYFDRVSTARMMWTLVAVLIPAAGWGVYLFGYRAAVIVLVSIASAVVAEGVVAAVVKRRSLSDGSAALTGLLIGMMMPPSVPVLLPVAASAFAILVVKWSFGGLGRNWMNPPLAGWLFVSLSWNEQMHQWLAPSTLPEAVSGATPLTIARSMTGASTGPMDALALSGYPTSTLDGNVTEWLNARVLGVLGIDLPTGYVDLFVGNVGGTIGEASALLLLLATIVLFWRRIITWHIPLAYFSSFALLTFAFGGLQYDAGYFGGDILFSVLSGGFLLSLFFFATDSVTSPATRTGHLVYGAGIGCLVYLLRVFGATPEAAGLGILVMNILVPAIDRFTRPRRFGTLSRIAEAQ